jgi:hypothetical protein
MAEVIMDVADSVKAGILDMAAHANKENGNAGSPFRFANDGRTVLIVDGVTGDTFTFTAVNDNNGRVSFVPTAGNAGDILLAVRVANPS